MEGMRTKLDYIISTYGEASQVDKTIEECAELQKALLKHRRNPSVRTRDDIIDELADVSIMLEQLKIILYCELETSIRMECKVDREMERIKHGKKTV